MTRLSWHNAEKLPPSQYTCGYCGNLVGPNDGFRAVQEGTSTKAASKIYICSYCTRPTLVDGEMQVPGAAFGASVEHLEHELETLFEEARNCLSVNAFSSAVLACRKILMHVAVDLGAKPGQSFLKYVAYLQTHNHIPPGSKVWVDHIRGKGNEANHEIRLSTRDEAELLLRFTEMLLRITYEFPREVPAQVEPDSVEQASALE